MSGSVRPYTLVDILQTIYTTAVGNGAGVSSTTPTSVITLVAEADETFSASDSAVGVSEAPRGWGLCVWGEAGWQ